MEQHMKLYLNSYAEKTVIRIMRKLTKNFTVYISYFQSCKSQTWKCMKANPMFQTVEMFELSLLVP